MADGHIIQYEQEGAIVQEQVKKKLNSLLKTQKVTILYENLDFSPSCDSCQIAVTQDGQIQYLPVRTKQQIVSPEDLEAAAQSAVTGRPLFIVIELIILFFYFLPATFSAIIILSPFINILWEIQCFCNN